MLKVEQMPECIFLNDAILNALFLYKIFNPMLGKQLGQYLNNATKPQQDELSLYDRVGGKHHRTCRSASGGY